MKLVRAFRSFVGNSFYSKQDIGTLIVNYRVRSLSKAIEDYKDLKGSILVMDLNGFVVFDSGGICSNRSWPRQTA